MAVSVPAAMAVGVASAHQPLSHPPLLLLHCAAAGIGSVRSGLHPVQAALANSHGSQCGFCTPGFVMSMYALLRSTAADKRGPPSEADIEECLAGNLW